MYRTGSAPCLEGGKLPFRDGAPLEEAKYSDAATLLRSSFGECTEELSGQDATAVSARCKVVSDWPNAKFAKPLLSVSTWRDEVKFVEVGSRSGLFDFETDPLPTAALREREKKDDDGVSAYCCEDCGCAMERFRAGDTPELRA